MTAGTTTRAFVFHGPGRGSIQDWDVRAAEVVVDVEACALCQREHQVWNGSIERSLPDVLGHEMVGRVVRAPAASGFERGSRVAGMGNYALAERTAVPAWQITPLDGPYRPQDALVEPLACAVNATREASSISGPGVTAVVVGLGLLGQLIGELWAAAHGPVVGVDHDLDRLALATRAGMQGIALGGDEEPLDEIVARASVAFECSGDAGMIERVSRLLPAGSVLAIVAHHRGHDIATGRLLDLWHSRGVKVWNAVPRTSRSMAECVRAAGYLVHSGRVDLGRFGVRCFSLGDTPRALRAWPAGDVFRNVIVIGADR